MGRRGQEEEEEVVMSSSSSEESVEMVLNMEEDEVVEINKENLKKLDGLLFLRVLLVEADDSSRMIISALLRKCGYRVAAVPDGLKAWEMLRGKPSNIDLVLTEMELPSIAGFSLLGMIMENDTCRHIPVIMMSSNDSTHVVFNCMLRGAADFLVKPLRKNEMGNLWQHVWRKRSLSDNVNHVQKNGEAIEDNPSTKCSSDCVALSKEHKECSEKGSDAQSSCTKLESRVESANVKIMQNFSHPDCRIAFLTSGMRTSQYGECVASKNYRMDATVHNEIFEDRNEQLEPFTEAMDLIGSIDNHLRKYDTQFLEVSPNDRQVHFNSNDDITKWSSPSPLELYLSRPHSSDHDIPPVIENNTLNHSNASAFSWYLNKPQQPSFVASSNFFPEAMECANIPCKDLPNQPFSHPAEVPWQNGDTLNNYSDTKTSLIKELPVLVATTDACSQHGVIYVPIPVRGTRADSVWPGYEAVLPPMFYTQSGPLSLQSSISASEQLNPENHDYHDQNGNKATNQTMHGQPQKSLESLEDPGHASPATGLSAASSLCNSSVSHLNSSGCGSNGNNGNVTTITIVGGGSGNDKGVLQEGTGGTDSHCFNQREAALNKFRLKRKDRCFDKKVRYQSRKRLAEQRPRVKGQFVRRTSS